MKLNQNMLTVGKCLFKYRGQIPIILFFLAIPIIYDNNNYYNNLSKDTINIIQYFAILLGILGLCVRFITIATSPRGTSGRNRKKQIAQTLNTTGLYSIVRNPLYLGNYLIWAGVGIYSLSYTLLIIISIVFFLIYERIILTEEDFLVKKYGKVYINYVLKTPCFFPKFKLYQKTTQKFCVKNILRQEYSTICSTVISYIYIDILLYYMHNQIIYFRDAHILLFIIILSIAITLKIIKTYTKHLQ